MCVRIHLHVHLPRVYADTNSYGYTYSFTYRFTYGDAYAPDADGNCDSDSHTDCNADSNCNSLSDAHPNSNCNSHCYRHTETSFSYTAARCPNTAAAPHACATSVTYLYEKETHCTIRLV